MKMKRATFLEPIYSPGAKKGNTGVKIYAIHFLSITQLSGAETSWAAGALGFHLSCSLTVASNPIRLSFQTSLMNGPITS
jgi:hypothetical protein